MTRLKLAIQKSGRLHEDSIKLLKECGIDIENGVNKLKAVATNFPLELFFLRDDDIPQYVEDGVADIGFVGENVVYEKSKKVEVAYALGFGKCRLSFAVSKNETFTGASFLSGKKIATSYPVLVQKYLKEVSLFNQPFVKNDKQTVEQMLSAAKTSVKSFTIYVVGEGIERKVDDFAAEVAAQVAAAKQTA